MADVSVANIPAGWYPDPMGLPQRRWWNSSSWTQHVTPEHKNASERQEAAARQEASTSQAVVDTPQTAHAYIPMAVNTPVQFRQPEGPRASGTAAVWMIAVMPAIQLAAVLVLILVLEDFGRFIQVAVAFVFFLWTAVLASHDKRRLLTLGHRKAATPWWLLLSPLAYLIARTLCVREQGGHGSAPMWVYILLSTIPAVVAISLLVGADVFRILLLAATR